MNSYRRGLSRNEIPMDIDGQILVVGDMIEQTAEYGHKYVFRMDSTGERFRLTEIYWHSVFNEIHGAIENEVCSRWNTELNLYRKVTPQN